MATSSDNSLTSLETWAFRSSIFEMPWLSTEAYARDTEALTRALQKSISSSSSDMVTPATYNINTTPLDTTNTTSFQTTQSFSNVSSGSSDPETAAPVSKRAGPKNGPKSMKRKSRASKRSPTTFITADPANFRQMVQQVTGVRVGFGPGHGPVLKPEPHRPGLVNRLQTGCLLPTLDTSAFLLDHHYQQAVGPHGGSSGAQSVGALGFGPSGVVAEGSVGVGGGSDFDGFTCFPTLESWS